MKPNNKKSVRRILWTRHSKPIANRIILIAIGLSAFFWLLDAVLDSLAFGFPGDFISQLFTPSPHEVWIRLIVAGILITFAIYAQFTVTRRKQAEESLKESEGKFETFSENVPGVVCIYDLYPDGHRETVYVGPGLEQLLGRSTADRIGNSVEEFFKLIHPDDLVKLQNAAVEAGGKGQVLDHEYRVRVDSGNYIWVRSVNQASRRGNGIVRWSGQVLNVTEHKEAEEALKRNEERYRELFNSMSSGVAVYRTEDNGRDFIFQDFNRAGERTEKVKREDVIGKRISEVFPDVDDFILLDVFQRVWKTGKPEEQILSAVYEGQRIVGWRENYVYKLPTGEIVSIFDDVTERKRGEEALRTSEEKYRGIYDESVAAIYVFDAKKNFVDSNQAGLDLLGYSRDELLRMSIPDVDADPVVVLPAHEQLLSGERLVNYEHRLKKKDGTIIAVLNNSRPLTDVDGNAVGMQSTLIDITERKQAEEALRESEERFRNLFETTREGLVTADPDGKILSANPAAAKMLGYDSAAELAGIHTFQFYTHPEQREAVLKELKDNDCVEDFETSVRRKDGSDAYILLSITTQRDEQGNILRTDGIFRDITERKRAEEALQKRTYQLGERVKELNCLYGISRLVEKPGITLEEIVQGAADHIPPGWQYPEITCARMTLEGKTFSTVNFRETRWKQSADIMAHGDKIGSIEVCYIEEKPERHEGPFLKEERNLIDAVAEGLGAVIERKRAERRLRESEEKYRTLVETAQEGIGVTDPDENLTFVNQAFADLLGYTKEELLALNLSQICDEEEFAKLRKESKKRQRGRPSKYETRLYAKTGEVKYFNVSASPLVDEKGSITATLGFLDDITERKRAEDRIREQNEFLNTVIESLAHPFMVIDANDCTIRLANSAAGAEDLTESATCYSLSHNRKKPCGGAEHRCPLEEVKKTRKPVTVEHIHYDRDGNARNVEVHGYPILNEDGNVVQMIEYYLDVTERKRAEELLRTSEAQLSNAMKIAKLGYWEYDVADDLFTFNDHFYAIFRSSAEQVGGYKMSPARYAQTFLHPDDMSVVADEMKKAFETTDPNFSRQLEHRIVYADGEIGYISVRFFIVKDNQGRTIKTYGANQDITERKRAEEDLKNVLHEWRVTFDSAKDLIMMLDAGFKVSRANLATARFLDRPIKEIAGKTCYQLLHGTDRPPEGCPLEKMRKTKEHEEKEFHLSEKDIWILASVDPILDDKGNVTGAVHIIRDITERKRAEEALRKSERQASAAIEAARALTFSYDITTGKIDWGGAIEEITGYTRRKFAKVDIEDWAERIHPDDRDEILAILQEATGKDRATAEYRFRTKKGYVTLSSISLTEKQDGKAVRLVGILQDITERKRAEETLRDSESKYRTLVKNIPQKIFIKNKDSVYVSCNENYAKDLKIKPDEIAGKTDYDFYPEALAEKYRGDDKRITESGTTEDIEERYIQDGRKLWVHTVKTPVKDENGNVIGVLGIFWDITERKRADEELRESEEKIKSILDSSPDPITVTDLDGNIIECNQATLDVHGFSTKEEVIGKNALDFITAKDHKKVAENTEKTLLQGSVRNVEYTLLTKDGRQFPGELSASVIRDSSDRPTSFIAITKDITERKKMEAQLIQAERLTAVGTLAYGIAHEFNNILAGILGNAEFGMGSGDSKEVERCFRVIMENCDRAGSITNSLLTLARQRQVKKEAADLTDAAENILGLVERELEKQNIRVERKFKPVPEIVCDLGELSEVFLNMITNARDAMKPDGGALTIEIRKRSDNIEIIFADTGGGIPDEIKGRIFEPFVTTKGALGQSEIPGTGLGLFLSYGIISRYQGAIEVESEEAKGSTFTIKIPVAENQQLPSDVEAEDEGPTVLPPNLNILLVDDEEAICSVVKKFLEEKGYSVVDTTSGKKGLKLFKDGTFDLALSDITMPDMDGVKLISELKNLNPDIRIVTLTGHVAEEKLEAARKTGADQVLLKPFRKEDLYRAIGRALSV